MKDFGRKPMSLGVAAGLTALAIVCALPKAIRAQEGNALYAFTGDSDGGAPYAGLTIDAFGNLYGTASSFGGGPCDFGEPGCGTVFELINSVAGRQYEVLHTFEGCVDGDGPSGGLVSDSHGKLYGTTGGGGSDCGSIGYGTVFELTPSADGWIENIIYRFAPGSGGTGPTGPLALDSDGNIYGVTVGGGDHNCECGVVFELKKPLHASQNWEQWQEIVLHAFVGTDGANPSSGVTLVPFQFCQGGLPGHFCIFGTTQTGGEYNQLYGGVVFQLLPTGSETWAFRDLYEFQGLDGRPGGPLVFDKYGTLYGMAGLNDGAGSVFELKPPGTEGAGWTEGAIYSFRGPPNDGAFSLNQGVIFDKAGNLYGTTSSGGSSYACNGGCGTVFRLSRIGQGTWFESKLYSLPGGSGNGAVPYAGVVVAPDGNVYGTTVIGGDLDCSLGGFGQDSGCGVVFQVSP